MIRSLIKLGSRSNFELLMSGETVGSLVLRATLILAAGAVGLFLMLPRGQAKGKGQPNRLLGAALATASFVLLLAAPFSPEWNNQRGVEGMAVFRMFPEVSASVTFYILAGVSLASAVMMITSRNPVYSALWFALVLLANSGLYFQQGAEFLAGATIIVYAGAIIVMFLFVVMLAQPSGTAGYDRVSREPLFSCLAGMLMSAALLGTIHYVMRVEWGGNSQTFSRGYRQLEQYRKFDPSLDHSLMDGVDPRNPFHVVPKPHVRGLGIALYRDNVVSIEVIGLLLLAAVVGAMLIAGHRLDAPPSASLERGPQTS